MNSDPSGRSIIGELIAAFVLLCTPVGGVVFQAATSLVCYAGIGLLGAIASLVFPPARIVGVKIFGISFALSIFFLEWSGLGGAD